MKSKLPNIHLSKEQKVYKQHIPFYFRMFPSDLSGSLDVLFSLNFFKIRRISLLWKKH